MKKKATKNGKPVLANNEEIVSELHSVYLYYISSDVKIYEWFDPDSPVSNPEMRITQLAINAYNGEKNPPYYTKDYNLMMMRRKGYLAFVVNGDDWKFKEATNIEFDGPSQSGQKPGVHTFSGDYTFTIEIGNSSVTLLVAYVKNTMQRAKGLINGKGELLDKEYENFKIFLPFVARRGGKRAPDSGGTNMGPPVPPPNRKAKGQKQKSRS